MKLIPITNYDIFILLDRSINELISGIEARRESKRNNQNKEKKEQNKR